MAKSSKLSDNINSNPHFIHELSQLENKNQSSKNSDEKDKKQDKENEKETEHKNLFSDDDYIIDIDDNHKTLTKENFNNHLEDIIDNLVNKSDYSDLSNYKKTDIGNTQDKRSESEIEKEADNSAKTFDTSKENDENLTGNFLDIDV